MMLDANKWLVEFVIFYCGLCEVPISSVLPVVDSSQNAFRLEKQEGIWSNEAMK